jgi:hypothetical protein
MLRSAQRTAPRSAPAEIWAVSAVMLHSGRVRCMTAMTKADDTVRSTVLSTV